MVPILHLKKIIDPRPRHGEFSAWKDVARARNYRDEQDILPWLQLRAAATEQLSPSAGNWTAKEFRREFLDRPNWNPSNFWVIENCQPPHELTGSIVLSLPKRGGVTIPSIHWLVVHPRFRRQGLASGLLEILENRVRALGYHEIQLETHAGWRAATEFYRKHGYCDAQSA